MALDGVDGVLWRVGCDLVDGGEGLCFYLGRHGCRGGVGVRGVDVCVGACLGDSEEGGSCR